MTDGPDVYESEERERTGQDHGQQLDDARDDRNAVFLAPREDRTLNGRKRKRRHGGEENLPWWRNPAKMVGAVLAAVIGGVVVLGIDKGIEHKLHVDTHYSVQQTAAPGCRPPEA
ncbi:hypothetical protein ACFV24_32915 [Nocardia fluminea]|uniref:hypothetical protein n=1 Tax=Nocardia fluminea TaxID=134984 RepID=UPI00366DCC3F